MSIKKTKKNNTYKRKKNNTYKRKGGGRTYFSKGTFQKMIENISKQDVSGLQKCLNNKTSSLGKSRQLVRICDDFVIKQQTIELSKRTILEDVKVDAYKLDSFTMMIMQQNIMKEIYNIYKIMNIEHPNEFYKEGNSITMVFDKANNVFENYVYEETRKNMNLKDEEKLYNSITDILITIFCVNDLLYEICQFQHCDMKCAQILLKKNNNGKLIPILSDFDKSTCTINIGFKPYRLRLAKNDTARDDKKGGSSEPSTKSKLSSNKAATKYVDYNKEKMRNNKLKSDVAYYKEEIEDSPPENRYKFIFKCSPKIKTEHKILCLSLMGILSIEKTNNEDLKKGGNIFMNKIKGLSRTTGINVGNKLNILSSQESERFEDYPLNSNKFYNLCLLSSAMLLCKSPEKLKKNYTKSLANKGFELANFLRNFNKITKLDNMKNTLDKVFDIDYNNPNIELFIKEDSGVHNLLTYKFLVSLFMSFKEFYNYIPNLNPKDSIEVNNLEKFVEEVNENK